MSTAPKVRYRTVRLPQPPDPAQRRVPAYATGVSAFTGEEGTATHGRTWPWWHHKDACESANHQRLLRLGRIEGHALEAIGLPGSVGAFLDRPCGERPVRDRARVEALRVDLVDEFL
jgi:hypothetical protein